MAFKLALPVETQRTLNDGDHRWRLEFATRAMTTFFSFIAIVIFATTVHQSVSTYGGSNWTDGLPIAPLLIALLYNIFLIAFTLSYRHGRTINPGFSVTADLFVWALGVPTIVFSVGDGWFWWWQPVLLQREDGFVPCVAFNWWSKPCNPLIYKLGKQEIAANVFLALVLIIHFVLFVRACVMTHRLRMRKKKEKARRRNIELQYHRNQEEHERHAPPACTPNPVQQPSPSVHRDSVTSPISPISQTSADEHAVKYA